MGLFVGFISVIFWPLLIVVGIVALVKWSNRSSNASATSNEKHFYPAGGVDERTLRYKIATEIRAQLAQYKNPTQKKVVEDMAQTVEYFADHSYISDSPSATQKVEATPSAANLVPVQTVVSACEVNTVSSEQPYETPWKKLQLLDGATILLYLGAFFVLASIGLYVGLGQGGAIKALLVTLMTAVFYGGGIVLYENSARLKPAGLTFVAIGMATLPMAGAATYYFALNEQHGPLVWLVTSLVAIVLYGHAMFVLRSSLVSYMVVFSTLSVVLASISSLGIAPYYFIQGMGFAGVIFAIGSRLFGKNSDLSSAYDRSAMFLVPFSVGLAVLFASNIGWLQLAFSLLLGTSYYIYASLSAGSSRSLYVLLAQLMGIASLVTGSYALASDVRIIALLSGIIGLGYIILWSLWARLRDPGDSYHMQVKYIVLVLPIVALFALLSSPSIIWLALVFALLANLSIYAHDHDWLSGVGWLTSLLALPLVVAYVSLEPSPTMSSVGLAYLVFSAITVLYKIVFKSKMKTIDEAFIQILFLTSLAFSGIMQIEAINSLQVVVGLSLVCFMTIHAFHSSEKRFYLILTSFVQIAWLAMFFDDPAYLFTGLLSVAFFNTIIAQIKQSTGTHDWLAVSALFLAPLVWGSEIAVPEWKAIYYWTAYTALFAVFVALRYMKKLLIISASSFGYITALTLLYALSFFVGLWFGYAVSLTVVLALLCLERLEKSAFMGLVAPLASLGICFHQQSDEFTILLGLITATCISLILTVIRKRRYEAYLGIFGTIISVWYAGTVTYEWSASKMMWAFLGLSASMIVLRFVLLRSKYSFKDALIAGYSTSLGLGLIYCLVSDWEVMSAGLFAVGLLFTAITYLESAPAVVILAFMAGYASLLRYTLGKNLGLTATIGIFIVLSQAIYWLLIISKLDTVRAKYARYVQISLAATLPLIGIGFVNRPIFPASLSFFSIIFTKELWSKGQSSREIAIFIVHSSGLWWLYALGVRELQLFTQSTALVIASFAFWRRKIKDSPSIINQYLWASVLIFTLPMVYEALANSDPKYSYLLLVEHVALIIVSIMLRRATFAWWGIGVTVAAVLYQLRKLRYAALAFLGAFIISLAVYFLLRYNKPEAPVDR